MFSLVFFLRLPTFTISCFIFVLILCSRFFKSSNSLFFDFNSFLVCDRDSWEISVLTISSWREISRDLLHPSSLSIPATDPKHKKAALFKYLSFETWLLLVRSWWKNKYLMLKGHSHRTEFLPILFFQNAIYFIHSARFCIVQKKNLKIITWF